MSQEEGSVSKEKQKEFNNDRKKAIEEMLGKSYIPHRKPNERISVKEFSQEGEEEMVVFDEIRLDQNSVSQLVEKRLSIRDFYDTYVTFARKSKKDELRGGLEKEESEKELRDLLLQSEITRLEGEKRALEKEHVSPQELRERMEEMSRIKERITELEKQRAEIFGASGTSSIPTLKEKVKKAKRIDDQIARLKSGNMQEKGGVVERSEESDIKDGVALKESIEKMESLDDLIIFIEGNEDGVQQYIRQEKENKPSVEALKRLQNILADNSLSIDQKTSKCAEELRKETNFPKITDEIGLFKRTKELVQNILKEERGDLKSDEKIDVQTLENDERVEKIPEFEKVKKEIQEVESFEEMYAILEEYKDDISRDIDTEMSYDDILEQIEKACENFESSVKNNLIDKNHFVVPQALPNEIFFKDEKITLSHAFWRNIFTKEFDRIQKEFVDRENAPHPEEGGKLTENKESPEKSALEQGIRSAKSLEDLIVILDSHQGEIVDGENTFSKEDIKGALTALSVSIATQGPDAPKPSENEQYQSDFFSHIPQTLQETVKKLSDKAWGETHSNTEKEREEVGKKDEDGEKLEPQEEQDVQGDHEEIKPGHYLIPVSSEKEKIVKEKKDEEGDFLRELTKELDDARREYAQDIYNGEKKKRYNDVLVRYNTEVSSRFGEFIGEKEFEQLVRANEIQEQLAIKDIRAEHLIEKAPLWEKGKSFLKDRVKQWKDLSLKQKLLVSVSIAGVGGIGLATGATVLGAGALVAGTAVRFVSAAATTTGFKGILESYAEKLYEGADRERMEQARSLFWENKYGSDSPEQRGDNVTRLLMQSAEKQADRARKRRLDRHARTAVALAGALTLAMASRCLGQTAVDALDGYFGGPLEGSGGVTEPQGKIDIGIEKEPIAYDKDYIFPDNPPQEYVPEIKTIEVPIERTPEEYIQAHPEMFREISERTWMDNNTSLQVGANGRIIGADLNELNLRWGGGGDGIDANGNYVFDVAKMTPDGSFHKDLSVDAREAIQKGQLKMLFTLDGDTQSYGIEIPVGSDGSVVIDPQSPEGKLLFQTVGEGADTKLEFKGKFAEVGVIGEDGKFTVLATHKGEGLESISDVIKKEIIVPQIDQEISPVELDAEPVGGGGETAVISEDVIIEDGQQEILPPITAEPTVPEEPVVPLGKEPSLERVIIGPGEVAILGLAGMGARKIHKARGGVSQSMIPTPVRRPEVTLSSVPLELEGKKDGEKIIASLRDYKEYEKGLSPEKKREIEKTAQRLQELSNKTEEELKSMSAKQFSTLPIGEKIKNRTSSVVTMKVGEENQVIEKLVREEMIDPKEGETAYDYIRRNIIQPMVLTREYK